MRLQRLAFDPARYEMTFASTLSNANSVDEDHICWKADALDGSGSNRPCCSPSPGVDYFIEYITPIPGQPDRKCNNWAMLAERSDVTL